jgi:anti-sigma factor RsiW
MTCGDARRLWHDAIDGAALAPDRARLREHLGRCDACREFAEQMQSLTGALDRLRERADDLFATAQERRSSDRAFAGPDRAQRLRTMPAILRAAAAIAFAAGVLSYGYRTTRPSEAESIAEAPPAGQSSAQATSVSATTDRTQGSSKEQRAEINAVAVVDVMLTGASADEYLPARRGTSQPNVHVFVLYPVVRPAPAAGTDGEREKPRGALQRAEPLLVVAASDRSTDHVP